jgi:hypothetical protein
MRLRVVTSSPTCAGARPGGTDAKKESPKQTQNKPTNPYPARALYVTCWAVETTHGHPVSTRLAWVDVRFRSLSGTGALRLPEQNGPRFRPGGTACRGGAPGGPAPARGGPCCPYLSQLDHHGVPCCCASAVTLLAALRPPLHGGCARGPPSGRNHRLPSPPAWWPAQWGGD